MTNITLIRRQNGIEIREFTTANNYREHMRQYLSAEGNKIVDGMSLDNMLFALKRVEQKKFGGDIMYVYDHKTKPTAEEENEFNAKNDPDFKPQQNTFLNTFANGGTYDDEQLYSRSYRFRFDNFEKNY